MQNSSKLKFLLSAIIFVGIILLALWLTQTIRNNEDIQNIVHNYGYIGLFLAAIISGFNLLVPIPAVSFLPALLESGLNYYWGIFFLTLGMTIADMIAYVLGRAGRGVFSELGQSKIVKKLEKIQAKHDSLPILLAFVFACIAPVPNEVLVIPLGFLRYKMGYIMFAVFCGNFVFNLLFSQGFLKLFNAL